MQALVDAVEWVRQLMWDYRELARQELRQQPEDEQAKWYVDLLGDDCRPLMDGRVTDALCRGYCDHARDMLSGVMCGWESISLATCNSGH